MLSDRSLLWEPSHRCFNLLSLFLDMKFPIILPLCMLHSIHASPPEDRLMKDILHGYVVEERPVIDSAEPVKVQLGVIFQQIVDVVSCKIRICSLNFLIRMSAKSSFR